MKKTIQHILSCALFLAIGACLLQAAAPILLPKWNHVSYGVEYPNAEAIQAEAPNTIDLLFVGNSESFYAFNPMYLWKEYGITSYVCGTGGQHLYSSEEYIQLAFRTQQPKYVVLETDTFYRVFDAAEELDNRLERCFPILRYHHRWRYLTEEDFTQLPDYSTRNPLKGLFEIVTVSKSADTKGYRTPTQEIFPFAATQERKVREISRLCKRKNTQLIFVSTPSTVNWTMARHNAIAALAQELGIPYLDLNLMPQEVPIDWNTDTWDGGDHMNFYGAEKVSAFCGRYFAEKGLPDHRGDPAYALWDTDYEEYTRQVKLYSTPKAP